MNDQQHLESSGQTPESSWDQAVSKRLVRLGTLPVDTSALDRKLQAAIPRSHPSTLRRILTLKPLRAIAASIVILLTIVGVLLLTSGGPVLASASEMARVHQDIVAGRVAVMQVSSIDEASRILLGQHPKSPDLPEPPEAHVMACCMKDIKDKKVACVLLASESVPVTMSVARASDMKLPKAPSILRDGVRYYVQSDGTINMVMAERDGRWICLIGELPADRLISLAASLRF